MAEVDFPTTQPPTVPTEPTPSEIEELVTTEVMSLELEQILSKDSIEAIREEFGEEEVEIPLLDLPDFKIIVKIDPVRMTAILNIESTAEQAKNLQDVIKADQGKIKARTEERMKKIEETLKKMDEAAKSSLFNKIFGWIMVAVAIIAAVAMSVVTGGVALGPVVGAVLALTFQILNETGATEKIIKALADSIQKTFGCDKATAQMWATIIWTVCQLAASIGGGVGANAIAGAAESANTILRTVGAAMKALKDISEIMPKVLVAVSTVSLLCSIGGQTWSTIENYSLGMSEAETTKFMALIKLLQDQMEEDEEMLDTLMRLLNESPGELLELLASALESEKQISEGMGGGTI